MPDLHSTLGMCEMEEAVARMVSLNGGDFSAPVGINMMKNDLERIGFVELVARGWMKKTGEPWCYNGCFMAEPALVERIKPRLKCV